MTALQLGALLLAVFLLLVAAMVWQETSRKPMDLVASYVVDEAVAFIYPRLSDEAMDVLDPEGVRRVLDWEIAYLQGFTPRGAGNLRPVRIAGSAEAISFVHEQLGESYGYSRHVIAEVLHHEAGYLAEIGAVGPEGDPELDLA